jgi:hypothetical protein
MGEFFGVFRAAMGLGLLFLIIAIPILVISVGIQYWPITILLIGGAIAGFIYYKRSRREKNMV